MKIGFLGLGGRGEGGGCRNGSFEGDPVFMFFISLFHFFLEKNVVFYIFVFLSNIFHCWHQSQSSTMNVSSIVGAPWRCGVLTTIGRDSLDWVGPPTWDVSGKATS